MHKHIVISAKTKLIAQFTEHPLCVVCGAELFIEDIMNSLDENTTPSCLECRALVRTELSGNLPWWPASWHGCWFKTSSDRSWAYEPHKNPGGK